MKSIELRWFFDDSETRKIALNWFKSIGGSLENPEVRTDYYLPKTFGILFGAKVRNYNNKPQIEIKEKLNTIEIAGLTGIGKVEVWNKWGFILDQSDKESKKIIENKSGWIKMEKSRAIVKFDILPENKYRVVNQDVDSVYNVEITNVKIGKNEFWTLGFETFRVDNDYEKSVQSLEIFYKEIMSDEILTKLKVGNCCGYPN